MVFSVSVRDVDFLENKLKNNEPFEISEECKHNSMILFSILEYVSRSLPEFGNLEQKDKKRIADAVSYLLRPEYIRMDKPVYGPLPASEKKFPDLYGENGLSVTFRNNPDNVTQEWKISKDENTLIGAELFRCYNAVLTWDSNIKNKISKERGTMEIAFYMADVTLYLVSPWELKEYTYTKEEISVFNEKLRSERAKIFEGP